MKLFLKIGIWCAALGVAGLLILVSGIVPIKASSGHWAVTTWFLDFAKKRSVATHSIGIEVPELGDEVLILKGAGAYQTHCYPCHGGVTLPQPPVPRHMTPRPPFLPSVISEYDPEELFYIVKHGIKFTGMPAWPDQQRDDEVWAVIAFLQELPGLNEVEYRERTQENSNDSPDHARGPEPSSLSESARRTVMDSCASCHGKDGTGRGNAAFPSLAGQSQSYLENAINAYAAGERHSGIMQPLVTELSPQLVNEIAAYYAGLSSKPDHRSPDPAALRRGEQIAMNGVPDERVPSCVDCHGPGATKRKEAYPFLAGQYADYLILQLELFQSEIRGGSNYAHLMHRVAPHLTPEQIRDVARFYQSQNNDN